MASISPDGNGRYKLQFKKLRGAGRATIRLGKVDRRSAEDVKVKVEHIIASKSTSTLLSPQITEWLANLPDDMHDKLAKHHLVEPRAYRTLQELIEGWRKHNASNWEPSTVKIIDTFVECITRFTGADALLTEVTSDLASSFPKWALEKGAKNGGELAKATVGRRVKFARQLFEFAKKKKSIEANPFTGVRGYSDANRERQEFVSAEKVEEVIEQTTDIQLKAIVAMARYGALRCPSEIREFEWHRINWEKRTMVVMAPKTERYAGHEQRTVPIFDDLMKYLEMLWDAAEDGATLLFPDFQNVTDSALRGRLETLVHRAGYSLWQKAWQNLRATREMEWFEQGYQPHVITQWM